MIPLGIIASSRHAATSPGAAQFLGVYPASASSATVYVATVDAGDGPCDLVGVVTLGAPRSITIDAGAGQGQSWAGAISNDHLVAVPAAGGVTTITVTASSEPNSAVLVLWRVTDTTADLGAATHATASPYTLTAPPTGHVLAWAYTSVSDRPRTLTGAPLAYQDSNHTTGHGPASGQDVTYTSDRTSRLTLIPLA